MFSRMSQDMIDKLTDRERQCLRLVAEGYGTKEIALRVGVSERRAAKIIDAANQKLGVSRRIDAARLLARHEHRGVFVIPGTTPPLEDAAFIQPVSHSLEAGPRRGLREERLSFDMRDEAPDVGIPLRMSGGVRNDLTSWQRLIWILALSALALLGLGTMAAYLGSLSERIVIVPPSGR